MNLRRTPFFEPAREIHDYFFFREEWRSRRKCRLFFSQVVRPGMLVFDVGANNGEYTRHFLSLGARVVAVEPNPSLVASLRNIYARGRLHIEPVAAGSAPGIAHMRLNVSHAMGSMSDRWVNIAQQTDRLRRHYWGETISVPVTTLDALVEKHGMPEFLKVDVEGFEAEVFAGLSILPDLISLELNPEFPDPVVTILSRCSNYECNYVVGQPKAFELNSWIPSSALLEGIRNGSFGGRIYGDIYLRRANLGCESSRR